ncbi:MAG: SUMF1/EgtB/PvdO family nonheme iron enzyme [Patescibacteria group bacterium]|nr:SUMF1/EgtB/PvdO family nonheme iron enzyme [Patescibacteria group bacterium]
MSDRIAFPRRRALAAAAVVVLVLISAARGDTIVMSVPGYTDLVTVTVGNTGNAADSRVMNDPLTTSGYGSVPYEYQIGKNHVTNAQYAQFLNAAAAVIGSTTNSLWNASMASDTIRGGIGRTGAGTALDPWVYTPKADFHDKPVNYVNWYSAARFTNWLTTGDTESGVYTFSGATTVTSMMNHQAAGSQYGVAYFLPSEDEWYKAAYYDPTIGNANDALNYWTYGTKSNTAPTPATATATGDVANPGTNVTNHGNAANWNGSTGGNVTTVGSAGPGSMSYYGAYDMAGNVFDWNEAEIWYPTLEQWRRGIRGASYSNSAGASAATFRYHVGYPSSPANGTNNVGFRIASIPEPGGITLLLAGAAGLLLWRRRRSC